MTRGLLVVGHGTRSPAGQSEFRQTVHLLAERFTDWTVQPAYLELVAPTIAEGIDQLIGTGVDGITVLPVLLFAAGHAKRDLPAEVEAAARRHPAVAFRLAEALGCHPLLLTLSKKRFTDACRGSARDILVKQPSAAQPSAAQPSATQPSVAQWLAGVHLVVVGRGSSDAEAIQDVREYAGRLAEAVGVTSHTVAFMAAARPWLAEVLDQLTVGGDGPHPHTVVVQPHLLFHGEVLAEVRAEVERRRLEQPSVDWRLAEHLGPAGLLADALADIARLTKPDRSTN